MSRIAVVLGLFALLLPTGAWADANWINQYGSVTITNSGIVSNGSQLKTFYGVTAPPGHSLGSVSFSTGSLMSGTIFGGGKFAGGAGTTFDAIGVGAWTKGLTGCTNCGPVTLFAGSFSSPIVWKVASHSGNNYVFTLWGVVFGQLWNGREAGGYTKQTIVVYQNQWFQDHKGSIRSGKTNFSVNGPEPGTLGLFATGLIVIAGAVRSRLFAA